MPLRLTAEDVTAALGDLARRLDDAGVQVQIAVVGAAAILLRYDPERDSTVDVDSWIACSRRARAVVDATIVAIAQERGWPDDWLNDQVAENGFVPEDASRDRDFQIFVEVGSVGIHVATPGLLFAMKLRAGRGNRDLPDLDILAPLVDVDNAADAIAAYEARYPEDPLKPTSRRWIEQHYG